MSLSYTDIERTSALIVSNSRLFIDKFIELINVFSGRIDKEAYMKLNDIFNLSRKIVSDSELIDYISPYFMKFKDYILSGDEEYMLNHDYEDDIVEHCAESTADLIRCLVTNIKDVYRAQDLALNEEIRAIIKKLCIDSQRHHALKKIISS